MAGCLRITKSGSEGGREAKRVQRGTADHGSVEATFAQVDKDTNDRTNA